MKYQKYLVLTFVGALFLPLLSAKSSEGMPNELNLSTVDYVELEDRTELGFDTSEYLPTDFDPYSDSFSIKSLNYMEEDTVELGFDTTDYLPEDFNPYKN